MYCCFRIFLSGKGSARALAALFECWMLHYPHSLLPSRVLEEGERKEKGGLIWRDVRVIDMEVLS